MKDGKPIGLTVYYETPDPSFTGYYAAYYCVHWMGPNAGWGEWETDADDGGAGNDHDQLDVTELTIVKIGHLNRQYEEMCPMSLFKEVLTLN